MSEQLTIKDVSIGCFKQNCFKIGTSGGKVATQNHPLQQKRYFSLEKKTLPNGYCEEIVLEDYPINSASVTSYADGADYRNDPAQAVANAPKRVNLGDVTEAQAFLENPQNYAKVYKDTLAKLNEYKAKMAALEKSAPKNDVKTEDKQ